MLEHWHTGAMTRRAQVLDALEPEAVASLNPRQLADMGLAPGENLRVTSRRGEIEIKAQADRDVPDGMIFIPFCFAEAAANILTNPQLDPIGKIPEFKFCAVRIEKAQP
jgi:formate dehydrogenase major subunit